MGRITYPVEDKIKIQDDFGEQKKWFKTVKGSPVKKRAKWNV